jgi:hypothetical protein
MDGLVGSTVASQLLQHHDHGPSCVHDWVVNSGAYNHTTSDAGNLTYVRPPHINDPSSIIVGNRSSLLVNSVGDTTLPSPFYLNNVLVTPDIIQNLVSVHLFM